MKEMLVSIARTVPTVLERSAFQVSLQGWPAATAVAVVGATVVATAIILRGNQTTQQAE